MSQHGSHAALTLIRASQFGKPPGHVKICLRVAIWVDGLGLRLDPWGRCGVESVVTAFGRRSQPVLNSRTHRGGKTCIVVRQMRD